jgi:hypothetical protein
MATAKLFQHSGSQAVPKAKPPLKTLAEIARYMRENFPEGQDFPDLEQPRSPQNHG